METQSQAPLSSVVSLPPIDMLPADQQGSGVELSSSVKGMLVDSDQFIVEIKDAETYVKAVEYAQQLAQRIMFIKEKRDGICGPLFKAHRNATSFFNLLLNPLTTRHESIERGTARFRVEQDRLRKLEQERREAEERRRKELSDAHDAAILEGRQRLEAFLKSWDNAISEDEDRARAKERAREQAARLEHAQVAEDVGHGSKVDRILENETPLAPAPIVISAPIMTKQVEVTSKPSPALPPPLTAVPLPAPPAAFVPEMTGVIKKTNYKFKVTNKLKLLQAILDGNLGIECISVNDGPKGPIGEKVGKYKLAIAEEYKAYGIEVWSEAEDQIRAPRAGGAVGGNA